MTFLSLVYRSLSVWHSSTLSPPRRPERQHRPCCHALSVSDPGGISCLEQEQKVAQDDFSFLCWHTHLAPAGSEHGVEGLRRRRSPQPANSPHICLPEIKDNRMRLSGRSLRRLRLQSLWSLMDFLSQVEEGRTVCSSPQLCKRSSGSGGKGFPTI